MRKCNVFLKQKRSELQMFAAVESSKQHTSKIWKYSLSWEGKLRDSVLFCFSVSRNVFIEFLIFFRADPCFSILCVLWPRYLVFSWSTHRRWFYRHHYHHYNILLLCVISMVKTSSVGGIWYDGWYDQFSWDLASFEKLKSWTLTRHCTI